MSEKKRILIAGSAFLEKCIQNYVNAVEAVGLHAVLTEKGDELKAFNSCDALLLPGGVDLNPSLYGEKNNGAKDVNDELDEIENALLSMAVKDKKSVLGICRGLQFINVFFGGSLIQNISSCSIHSRDGEADRVHSTNVYKQSFVYDIYKEKSIMTNSAHHQAIKRLAPNLEVAQESEDGLIEAICHKKLPIIALQWHPERMCLSNKRSDTVDGLKVFQYFKDSFVMLR